MSIQRTKGTSARFIGMMYINVPQWRAECVQYFFKYYMKSILPQCVYSQSQKHTTKHATNRKVMKQ